jgi:hypothetical protein
MIHLVQPAGVEQAVEVEGIGLGDIGLGKTLAEADTEVGIALDDEDPAGGRDAAERLGGDGPGARAEFDDTPGLVKINPIDDGPGQDQFRQFRVMGGTPGRVRRRRVPCVLIR